MKGTEVRGQTHGEVAQGRSGLVWYSHGGTKQGINLVSWMS